jgi:uncharacterized protein (TIGR02217 family)
MAFIDTLRFPTSIAYAPIGGAGFSTEIAAVLNGKEQRNQNWSVARRRYEVASAIKLQSDYEAVRDCLYQARGRLHSFRFKDWLDYRATTAAGVGNGVTTLISGSIYQAVKRYGSGAYAFDRDVTKLVAGTVAVFRTRSGTTTDITGATTIDAATGQFTVTGHAGGDVYTWSGEFDVPVRFEVDQERAVIVDRNPATLLIEWQGIELVEVRGE